MTSIQPEGFLAHPQNGTGNPVLVLHAWWGLNDTIKDFCRHLAENGFTAFAPDLYHGKVVDSIPEAQGMSSSLNEQEARADIRKAMQFLLAHAGQPQGSLAVIGFSLGAWFALDLSTTDPSHVHSVVVFYGTGPRDFSQSQAAYLGHFAEKDEFEPPENVNSLESTLRGAGRPATLHRYPGTGHWFFEPDRKQAYNQAAADLAWERTLAFLKSRQ